MNERASKKIAEARSNFQPEPLFIRPSAQWYATNDLSHRLSLSEAQRDEHGVWHVCYSTHSSRQELELALQILHPKWVISTTPPCRAMELDYVKKHCYKTRIAHDDPIWKLFNGRIGKSATSVSTTNSSFQRDINAASAEISQASKELSVVDHLDFKLDLSTPPIATPITLFGRARLGDQHINIFLEEKQHCSVNAKNNSVVSMQEALDVHGSSICPGPINTFESLQTQKQTLSLQNTPVEEPNMERFDAQKCLVDIASTKVSEATKLQNFEYLRDDNGSSENEKSSIGSSKNINVELRRLYRSMNVPVPRPLPSVVDLMNSIKRIKTVPEFR